MRTANLLASTLLVAVVIYAGCTKQSELSGPQEWTFATEKVWEFTHVGEDSLLRPAEPRVADDGTLYFRDFDRNVSYIVSADGNPVDTFAARGANEGEVSFYFNCFPAGDHVVICAPDALHFFPSQGQFVKAVPNNLFVRFPLSIKNDNEFWVGPGALGDSPGGSATITRVNLATGEETNVRTFALTEEERKPSGGGVVLGLTPQAAMAYDRASDRIFFGKNSDSVIYCLDGKSGAIDSFTFAAARMPVSETDKRDHFAAFGVPEERLAPMIAALPDRMAYYNRLQVIDGLVYLFGSDGLSRSMTGKTINVYSPDGRHLYRGRIQVEEGWHIANPDNLQLGQGFVYAVLENDDGVRKIVKYTVALPHA